MARKAQAEDDPPDAAGEGGFSREIIRRRYRRAPIAFYHIRERILDLTSTASFVDSVLVVIAFLATLSFMGFYPIPIAIILLILLFVVTLFQPFLGLILFTIVVFPAYMYQTPLLAWSFIILATLLLIFGYMYYRVAVFVYVLFAMAFSPFGYLLEIPFFIFAVLTIGNKRAIMTLVIAILLIVSFSSITGLQNTGYIVYDASSSHMRLIQSSAGAAQVATYDVPTQPPFTLSNFAPGFSSAVSGFFSSRITDEIGTAFPVIATTFTINAPGYITQAVVLAGLILAIDWYASKSRSKYKGTYASMFGIAYPIFYVAISVALGLSVSSYAMPFLGFVIAPAAFYILEYYDINMVKVLEVKKQDIRMKFGEAFEDLAGGNPSETFEDIGDYESTKKELKDSIIAPIEHRGVSHAYNIRPTKGILFFGPPGAGKTMMMRALANEIHAGFFYVKATNIISAYPGESERSISHVFSTAKKNAPCVLFLDEIDSLALSRENPSIDDTHRHALSQLLAEMDGFQKVNNVIVVGATNRPDLMDKAIIRPGRFDKIIYMPLPDVKGRKKIFEIYLSKLPISRDIDTTELANRTERYSGADIKAVCESIAQISAQEAASEHKILEITQEDMLNVIKSTKPSTSLAQLEEYRKFKLDFERNVTQEKPMEESKAISFDQIVGLDAPKKAIREAIQIPLLRPELMKKYGIKAVNGLLLFGPPGNGKTMLMKAISSEMKGVTMLELSGSELAESGIESATATIKETFNRARENAPAVVFIDELDGIFPKRQGASETGVQITSELLTEIDGLHELSNVVVVGATNRPDVLDPAILRPGRFDKLIFVKPPGPAARAEMFRRNLSDAPCERGISFDRLSSETKGFTGADIVNVCREAKTRAMEQEIETGAEGKVSMETLGPLIENTRPSAPEDTLEQYLSFLKKYGER